MKNRSGRRHGARLGFARGATATALALVLLPAGSALAQRVEHEITDIRMGFGQVVKPGYWAPVTIDARSKNGEFHGTIELTTPDSDGLNTSLSLPNVLIPRNTQGSFQHYVKFGNAEVTVRARLIALDGQVVAEHEVSGNDRNQRIEVLDPLETLLVSYGTPAGLHDAAKKPSLDLQSAGRVMTRTITLADWPTQWFALGAVDAFVVSTSSAGMFDRINNDIRASALRTWVRQGGTLVVSVANNWQVVSDSFLGPMLPARLTGVGRVRSPDALEDYAGGSGERLRVGAEGLPVVLLDGPRGRTILASDGQPLVVTGSYGLGKVTLIAFDTDAAPFQDWKGAAPFWKKLLDLTPTEPSGNQNAGRGAVYQDFSDMASVLRQRLEDFPDVKVVPFGWVALLIFGYILLIGPIDYFFLKKVVGRLELTWITFPTWVVVISLAAYFAAHWLKGDDLRINRIEVVDVDVESGTLRGSSYMALFSPRVARYDVAMEPGLAAGGPWSDLGIDNASSIEEEGPYAKAGMGRGQSERLASWLGVPESSYRGLMNSGGSGLLGRRAYRYASPEPTSVRDVPIQVWSVKTFENRWIGQAGPIVEADLHSDGVGLTGTIANLLDRQLLDVSIAYGDRVYEISRLAAHGEPGADVDLAAIRPRSLSGLLGRNSPVTGQSNYGGQQPPVMKDTAALVRGILYAGKRPTDARAFRSRYLHDLDLSDRLEFGKAILLAHVDGAGGRLWLDWPDDDAPAPDKQPPATDGVERTDAFLRLILQPTEAKP